MFSRAGSWFREFRLMSAGASMTALPTAIRRRGLIVPLHHRRGAAGRLDRLVAVSDAADRDPARRPGRGDAAGRLDHQLRLSVTTTGWPFRARVEIPHAEHHGPSGHGVAAPELVAEANAYNPDRWVVIAPEGLTLTRADKGKVGGRGDGLRLSVSHLRDRFPDLRVELVRPTSPPIGTLIPSPSPRPSGSCWNVRPHLTDGKATPTRWTWPSTWSTRAVGRRPRRGRHPAGPSDRWRSRARCSNASRLSGMDSAGCLRRLDPPGRTLHRRQGRASGR
jgi:hypothetical protein